MKHRPLQARRALRVALLAGLAMALGLAQAQATGAARPAAKPAAKETAQEPVAVVEEVRGKAAGVEFMDYVAAGRVIQLGATDTLVLGYLHSCWREVITGGTVTVGTAQSTVQRGKVERRQVECDGRRAAPGAREGTQSAATVFRTMRADGPAARPQATVHGQSPVIEVQAARGTLFIDRLDESAARIELVVAGSGLLRERFFDLFLAGVVLEPGGVYAARLGERSIAFKVAPGAEAGASPLAGRLLQLP